VQPWAIGGKDSSVAEVMKMSEEKIALAFRVPLQILGLGGPTYGSTEALMQSWIASGLGFCLNHVEEAFGVTFTLAGQPDEYVEFDTAALLRSAFKDRIDALTRGVQGGILSPNEAREREGLDSVKFGDEPRVQQQVVPLSAAGQIPAAPGPKAPPSAAGQPLAPPGTLPALPKPKAETADEKDTGEKPPPKAKDFSHDIKREAQRLVDRAKRINRNFN